MWGDQVCVAGVDDDGNCIRPVKPDGVRTHHLFQSKRLVVFPRAKVEFRLSPTEVEPPHIEDMQFNADSMTTQGPSGDDEWEAVLQRSSFASLSDIFDGLLQEGRKVPPGAQTRSLGTIDIVHGLDAYTETNRWDKSSFRLQFQDASGNAYSGVPIQDLTFRAYFREAVESLGEAQAGRSVTATLRSADRVYLRIGVARPWEGACWTQVTGIYTFPDYLHGKTFADFT